MTNTLQNGAKKTTKTGNSTQESNEEQPYIPPEQGNQQGEEIVMYAYLPEFELEFFRSMTERDMDHLISV